MNVLNATAVYALCRELGVELGAVAEGLATYKGAARRQEIVGEAGGVTVVDDFAHHPTAVGLTIDAIRGRFPNRRLWAVFEPRSNSSRRAVFQQAFTDALAKADAVALSAVFRKDNDPLKPEEMLSTDRLVADLTAREIPAWTDAGPDEILARLSGELREGDVVLCMSNGAFGGLPRKLLEPAASKRRPAVAISDMTAGQAYLPLFQADHNRRFARAPQNSFDAHRQMRECERLDEIFSLQDQHQLSENLTLSHKRVVYVMEDTVENRRLRGRQVTVHEHEDGKMVIRHAGRVLEHRAHAKDVARISQGSYRREQAARLGARLDRRAYSGNAMCSASPTRRSPSGPRQGFERRLA